jgi:hypothetical protein
MKTLTAFAFVLALISWVATWIGLSGTWVGDDWEAVGAPRMPRRLGTSGLRRDRDVVGAGGIGTLRPGATPRTAFAKPLCTRLRLEMGAQTERRMGANPHRGDVSSILEFTQDDTWLVSSPRQPEGVRF